MFEDPFSVSGLMQVGLAAQVPSFEATLDAGNSNAYRLLLIVRAAREWADNGFPAVEMSHTLAAALISTTTATRMAWPWSTFLLRFPQPLIEMPFARGWAPVSHALVSHALTSVSQREGISFALASTDGQISEFSGPWDELRARAEKHEPLVMGDYEDSLCAAAMAETKARRALCCAIRLIANTCCAMSDPKHVQRVGKGAASWPFSEQRSAAISQKTQLFRLGTPVKIDCREAVRDYLSGAKRSLASVRWLVRGHWTHQPCGPGRVERRLQWIEPYWKGDASLPINVRPHQLVDEHT